MEVTEMLKRAWAAVEEAELPEAIHETAFREAVRILSLSTGTTSAAVLQPAWSSSNKEVSTNSVKDTSAHGDIVMVSEDTIYDRVASQTGVDRSKLEQLVHLDDGTIKLSIPGIKLGRSSAERTRSVAQILTIARGFGLEEKETPLEVIRAECDRLRVYDQNNFSNHVKGLAGYVVTGTGANRRIRARTAGIQVFPGFVDSLLGDE